MDLRTLIAAIAEKHKETGIDIYAPATSGEIQHFEQKIGFSLPADFKEFYSICNGFACQEDIFNMMPLQHIIDDERHFGNNWFYFAEYMIFCDMWTLRINANGQPEIVNGSYPEPVLTSSLYEFLQHFLTGNVFDAGGLEEWHTESHSKLK